MDGQVVVARKAEAGKFKKYLDDSKLVGITTPDGLFYTITTPGTGDKPAVGDTAEVFYVAKFTTGKVFETNVKEIAQKNNNFNPGLPYKAIRIPVGVKKVIPGWDEGLMQMNKGAKATLVVPSKLAYGEQGFQIVPPFTPLVFDIELVSIIHPNAAAAKPAAPVLKPTVQVKPANK